MRRLPPQQIEKNLSDLIDLVSAILVSWVNTLMQHTSERYGGFRKEKLYCCFCEHLNVTIAKVAAFFFFFNQTLIFWNRWSCLHAYWCDLRFAVYNLPWMLLSFHFGLQSGNGELLQIRIGQSFLQTKPGQVVLMLGGVSWSTTDPACRAVLRDITGKNMTQSHTSVQSDMQ